MKIDAPTPNLPTGQLHGLLVDGLRVLQPVGDDLLDLRVLVRVEGHPVGTLQVEGRQ